MNIEIIDYLDMHMTSMMIEATPRIVDNNDLIRTICVAIRKAASKLTFSSSTVTTVLIVSVSAPDTLSLFLPNNRERLILGLRCPRDDAPSTSDRECLPALSVSLLIKRITLLLPVR